MLNKEKTRHIVLIPARGSSKGVPGKNMRIVGTKPLLAYTVDWALEKSLFSDVFLSTDCQIIQQYAKHRGLSTLNLRSSNNIDSQSASQLISEFLEQKPKIAEDDQTIIWYLQPTTPFREDNEAKKILNILNSFDDNWTSLMSVRKVPLGVHAQAQFEINQQSSYAMPLGKPPECRQNLRRTYIRDGGFYLTRPSTLREFGNMHGDQSLPYIRTGVHVNIDDINDLIFSRKICAGYLQLKDLNGWKNVGDTAN